MRRLFSGLALCLLPVLGGCHSHYIQATITNKSASKIDVVQVDYPSASFGVQALAPGAVFHYRFKLLGSGNINVTFTDAAKAEHKQAGPWLNEGQEGTLDIVLEPANHVDFNSSLKP